MNTEDPSTPSAVPTAPAAERAMRFAEVDWLKAIGILVVVLIHTVRSPWEIGAAPNELWIGRVTRFAVPAFLMASGFLYATRLSVPFATTRGRLTRILTPYLVFTVAAQLLRYSKGQLPASGSLAGDVFLANSFGPYYYVFIAAIFAATAPLLARCSPTVLTLLLVPELAAQAYLEIYAETDLFWHLRNPLLWLSYFQVGWLARLAYPRLQQISSVQRATAVGLCLVATGVLFAALGQPEHATMWRTLDWLAIWAVLGAIFFSICGRERRVPGSALARALSDVTYPVYLSHLFFLAPLQALFPAPRGVFDPLSIFAPWAGSLLLAIALVYIGRRVLGERSRTWLGA